MSQGVVYRLNLEEIKAHLELTNQFDADASCM
jgi:hypothetical protein